MVLSDWAGFTRGITLEREKKGKVLVLGTFHMSEHEGLFSERRQTEIGDLVSILADFKPTKIAVEMIVENSKILNEKYEQYKLSNYNLEMNEIFQIGFRLGLKLDHKRIYSIDWMGSSDMDYGEVEKWAKENQPELLNEIYDGISLPKLTESKSIKDYYKELNDPTLLIKLHKMYVNIARIGDVNNYVGMNWLSWWYKRNLIMYSNLTRLLDSEDERVLYIVGSSHSTIVSKFLEESDVCEIVLPLNYIS